MNRRPTSRNNVDVKRLRLTKRRFFLIAALLTFVWSLAVLFAIYHEASAAPSTASADVIIVLGAAIIDEKPSPVFAARLREARDLFRQSRAPLIILTGGRSIEDKISEARAGKNLLIAEGISSDCILIEEHSRTTRENLAEAHTLMREYNLHTALIVSDPLHLLRTRLLCQDLNISSTGIATSHTRYLGLVSRLRFASRELIYLHQHWLLGR